MKVVFTIQGEGRGHLMQAIAMKRLLENRGDEVIKILIGKSASRVIPSFFEERIGMSYITFNSPNFVPSPKGKRVDLFRSIGVNLLHITSYIDTLQTVRHEINEADADLVINFYDVIVGCLYLFDPPRTPMVAIANQYMYLHRQFHARNPLSIEFRMLNFFSRLTSFGAVRRIALSFYPIGGDASQRISVVPPLLRQEVLNATPTKGDYLHGYLLNHGFSEDIIAWQHDNPEQSLHFFWDKKGAKTTEQINDHLTFHTLDDTKFLEMMKGCKGYATTAGFESICEAFYLQKPVMMVPVHIEQECNAHDAAQAGAGIFATSFDLSQLLNFIPNYTPNQWFRAWVEEAYDRIGRILDEAVNI